MQFLDGPKGSMVKEWRDDLHPETRTLLLELERWSSDEGLPEPLLTQVCRDVQEQVSIYVAHWKKLLAAAAKGEPMSEVDARDAARALGKSDAELVEMARTRFTWHWVRCAADVRTRHYSAEQLAKVERFFVQRVTIPNEAGSPLVMTRWEYLVHDIHGPHLHIAYKDFQYRARFDPRHPLTPIAGEP